MLSGPGAFFTPQQDSTPHGALDSYMRTALQHLGDVDTNMRLQLLLQYQTAEREAKAAEREAQAAEREAQAQAQAAEREAQAAERAEREREAQRRHELEILRLRGDASSSRSDAQDQGDHKPRLEHFPMLEKDGDLDVFLRGFEKVCRQFHLPKEQWGRYLTPRLRGKALDVFASLPSESDQDYEAIKSALLKSFNLTPEAYRKKFRTLQQSATESCTEHAGQLRTAFRQWTGGLQVSTYEALEDLMVLDQFLQTRSFEAKEWILDRKPKTVAEAAELGDDFANNRAPAAKRGSAQAGASTWRGATHQQSTTRQAGKLLPSASRATGTTLGQGDTRRCYRCNNIGHLSATCPNRKNFPPAAGGHTAVLLVSGAVEKREDNLQSVTVGDRVTVGLRDSGASFTLVRPEVVDTEDIIPGRTMALKGIGGVRPAVPMARVYLDWGTGKGLREVGVSEDIPVNVLLGNDLGRMLCHYAPEDITCKPDGLGESPVRPEVLCETLGDIVKCDHCEGGQGFDKCLPVISPKCVKGCIVKCDYNEFQMPKPSGVRLGRGFGVPLVTCKDEGPAVCDVSQSCEPEMAEEEKEEGRSDVYDACNVMSGTEGEEGKPPGGIPILAVVTRQQCARAAAAQSRDDCDERGELCDLQAQAEEGGDLSTPGGNVLPDATRWGEGNEHFREALRSDPSLEGLRHRAEQPGADTDGHRVYWDNNILYWESLSKDMLGPQERERQLVVPRQFRKELLRLAHETPLAGHLGVAKTKSRLAHNFYWPGMGTAVANYCRSCHVCQRVGKSRDVTRVPLVPLPVISVPFERVAVDIVWPLAIPSSTGKQFILTVVDYATRYPEAVALSSVRADKVADALISIFCRVGFPREMLTDQGTQFMSNLMQSLCKKEWEGGVHSPETSVVEYVLKFRDRMQALTGLVHENLIAAQSRQKYWYDRNARDRVYEVGQKVMVLNPIRQNKLQSAWEGPFSATFAWECRACRVRKRNRG